MSYVSHDGLAYFKHKLDQKFISNITSEDGALKIVLGDGTVLKNIQDTTVTQKKSTANELYPLLLCYDAMADQDQLSKETWFGQHILANPYYGYLASRGMYVKHPTFNRRNGVSQKVEWAYDFTDAVSGLGNPMSQVYAYVDPAAQGGEHCIELRLYGNPNVSPVVPSINDSTNTFSIGVGVTGGNVQFGYCPSTPLYLDDGSTLRTEATGHGTDIITRDWLNLNGSLTGLVHTTMNETIDGAKTFKKTVTINSGDNNNKAGLYVQGNSDVHGNEHVYGTETVDGKLTANGTAEIKGGSGNTPSLTVTGDERVTGNSTINGNETVTGKITGNNGAEINGGNGLVVNGNETVNGEIYKLINNTPQEYVSYVTNKQETKTTIVNNLIKDKGGLAADANKNIYVDIGRGLAIDNAGKINVDFTQMPTSDITNVVTGMVAPGSGLVADSNTGKLAVDFNQMPTDKFEALLSSLKMLIPLSAGMNVYVDDALGNDTLDDGRGSTSKPFKTIQAAINYVTGKYSLGTHDVYINIRPGTYITNTISCPSYSASSGVIVLKGTDTNNRPIIKNLNHYQSSIGASGGQWHIQDLICENTVTKNDNVSTTAYPNGIIASDNSRIHLYHVTSILKYEGDAPSAAVRLRNIVATNGASIIVRPSTLGPCEFSVTKGNATAAYLINVEINGTFEFNRADVAEVNNMYKCYFDGDPSIVVVVTGGSFLWTGGAANSIKIEVTPNKTLTGMPYYVSAGGSMRMISGSEVPTSSSDEGSVETSSYSWYKVV